MSPKPVAIGCCLCTLFVTAAVAQQSERSGADRSKQRHLAGHSQFGERASEFERLDAEIIAVSQDTPEQSAKSQELGPLKMRLASDAGYANARRFKSYDDFEEIGIHSTILIDKDGRVYWGKHGGSPFDDFKFLTSQLQRMNEKHAAARTTTTAARN